MDSLIHIGDEAEIDGLYKRVKSFLANSGPQPEWYTEWADEMETKRQR